MSDIDTARALFLKALPLLERRDFATAEKLLTQTLNFAPRSIPTLNNLAIAQHAQKNFSRAEATTRTALSIDPGNIEALLMLSACLIEQEKYEDAIEACQTIVKLNPAIADAHGSLGYAFKKTYKYPEAVKSLTRAIEIQPNFSSALLNLGNVYCRLKDFDRALSAYDQVLAQNPALAEAWLGRGNVLAGLRRYGEAATAYDKALTLDPELAAAWLGRGRSRLHLGQTAVGRQDYEKVLSLGGDKDAVAYDLARFGLAETPAILPRKVVTELFDDYADHFDDHLQRELKYDAPAKLPELFRQHVTLTGLDVLDLGCGTGLVGVHVRPIAKTLTGVDLSQRMLDKAKARGLYNELICTDIVAFLETCTKDYDLIIATDVFIYIGDLTRIYELGRRRLRGQGHFCFTVESASDVDYTLAQTGRYQQSKEYLQRLAARNGFAVVAMQDTVIRQEVSKSIAGFNVVMRCA